MRVIGFAALGVMLVFASAQGAEETQAVPSTSQVLEKATSADWRDVSPENALYLDLEHGGRVIMELAPEFAPRHAANIRALVREHYFDGLVILRAQDNYVVQWGDADEKREIKTAKKTLPGEFFRSANGLHFTPLPDPDTYAPETGFSDGFPAARNPKSGEAWLAHCYGALGVGRGMGSDSGGGSELYVVIGEAPRHLDRNITLAGRVLQGMELLSTLPRGTAAMGFYDKPEQYVKIKSIRLAADVPATERAPLQVLRTDTPTWTAYVDTRRNRRDPWFIEPTGHVELCNLSAPVRATPKSP